MPAKEVRAGGAFVEFSLRRKGLERQLRQVGQRIRQFGGQIRQIGVQLGAVGGLITAPFAASLATFTKVGDRLDKLSQRTGIAVDALSEIGFAARQNGSSLDAFGNGIRVMNTSLLDLERNLSTQAFLFEQLKLSFEDLRGLDTEQRFLAIADAISKIEDPGRQAAVATRLFGRAGSDLLPLLKQGAEAIAEYRKEARILNIDVAPETARQAAKLGDAFSRVRAQVTAAAIQVGAKLAPSLTKVLGRITKVGSAVIEWVKDNGDLIRSIALVGSTLTAVGAALVGLGTAIGLVGFAVTSLAALIGAILSPVGLLVAGLTGATVALLRFTDIGGQAVRFLQQRFGRLTESVNVALGGIKKAFEGRDLLLAAQILWTTIKLIAVEGAEGVINKAIEMKGGILKSITETTLGVVQELSNLFESLQQLWTNITAGSKTAFRNLTGDAIEAFNLVALVAAKGLNRVFAATDEDFDLEAADKFADDSFVSRQKAIQKTRSDELTAIEETRKAEIQKIKDNAKARKEAIRQSLALELDAIERTKDAQSKGVRNEIERLRDQQQRLLKQADEAAAAAKKRLDEDERFNPINRDTAGIVAAAGRAAGVTSSFNIRGLSGSTDIAKRNLNANEKAAKELGKIKEVLSGDFLPLNIT